MALHRIKLTQVPRLTLAGVALLLFFIALGYEMIEQPINFREPFWAFVMVGFLLLGISMLIASWVIGLETRAEIFITLFMMALHIAFDFFIFVQVFILHNEIPVFLVQGVVQAYWVAGLFDVVLMFWAANWQRTAPEYVSPEAERDALKQEIAIMRATSEVAQKKHEAICEKCGRVFRANTPEGAEKAVWGHKPHCKGAVVSQNGHGNKEVVR